MLRQADRSRLSGCDLSQPCLIPWMWKRIRNYLCPPAYFRRVRDDGRDKSSVHIKLRTGIDYARISWTKDWLLRGSDSILWEGSREVRRLTRPNRTKSSTGLFFCPSARRLSHRLVVLAIGSSVLTIEWLSLLSAHCYRLRPIVLLVGSPDWFLTPLHGSKRTAVIRNVMNWHPNEEAGRTRNLPQCASTF